MTDKINEKNGILVQGHIKIHDPEYGDGNFHQG